MATHSRGAPYPVSTDANDTPAWLNSLALWVNERPGVTPATTTQRNAMSGVERWDGRLVLDTTLDRLQRWDAGSATWVQLPDTGDIAALLATTGLPSPDAGTASRGVSSSAARADHVHPHPVLETINTTTGITLAANVVITGDGTAAIRKGGVVTVEVYVLANANIGSTILTMPAGWRPGYIVRDSINLASNTVERAVNLALDGSLNVEGGMTTGQIAYGSLTYVTA